MLSRRGNRMHRFEGLLARLPAGCILDGEIVALDDEGRPRFRDLYVRPASASLRRF